MWPPVSVLPDEYFPLVAGCLEDHGFTVTVDVQQRSFYFPGDQPGSKESRIACQEEIDPSYLQSPPPFTDPQLVELYQYQQSQIRCFADLGYESVTLPSYEIFMAELRGRFDVVGQIREETGEVPSDAETKTCRERDRPYWFLG